ncbi:MAG: fumarylacetoacetate hydrolase family protein [Rhodospirillales bacterium]|nr:fumarylacetoacetate hydrolase family protein [Rhodospirillales bacterium]
MRDSLRPLIENRLRPGPWPGFVPNEQPQDEAEAYQLQFELHSGLTKAGLGKRVGWKIGCTTPIMQKFMSIDHPCSGGVMEHSVHFDHLEGLYANFNHVGVECEIAVTLGQDLPPKSQHYDSQNIRSAIQSCRAAMEIVDDRYADFRTLTTESMIVDDFFQSACVLGPEVADWQNIDLAGLVGCTIVNGEEVGSGQGADIMGHPLNALAWLANNLNDLGRQLKAGEFVLLGSMVECQWLSPNDQIVMQNSELGQISADFSK